MVELVTQALPQRVRVFPSGPLHGVINPPSSKYLTLRYILTALLADGTSTIHYPATSHDTDVLLTACTQLGASCEVHMENEGRYILTIRGTGGKLKSPPGGVIDVGNAGAVLRLLLGICATLPEIGFTTNHSESLGKRPNEELLQALTQLGATVIEQGSQGTLPIRMNGGRLRGGKIQISGESSSQFTSSLLYLTPLFEDDTEIEITGKVKSASFIDLTIKILAEAGIAIEPIEPHHIYRVRGGQTYRPGSYTIPGDFPSTAAILSAVAIAGGKVEIKNLPAETHDGDIILGVFSEMGLDISWSGNSILVNKNKLLRGISFDGDLAIDSIPAIAATSCFAGKPSHIYNISGLRRKESDRIFDLAQELNKTGCRVVPGEDSMSIYPQLPHGGVDIDAHNDHRLISALTNVGLGCREPVVINDAHHIGKSYPRYFEDLRSLGAHLEEP